eukprot:COSAG01_NODE_378_length_17882_cov_62.690344_6_plen_179_part_00
MNTAVPVVLDSTATLKSSSTWQHTAALQDSGSFPRGGVQRYLYADLRMQGWWVAVRSALNLGAPRAACSRGGGWVVLCRSVWDRQYSYSTRSSTAVQYMYSTGSVLLRTVRIFIFMQACAWRRWVGGPACIARRTASACLITRIWWVVGGLNPALNLSISTFEPHPLGKSQNPALQRC